MFLMIYHTCSEVKHVQFYLAPFTIYYILFILPWLLAFLDSSESKVQVEIFNLRIWLNLKPLRESGTVL